MWSEPRGAHGHGGRRGRGGHPHRDDHGGGHHGRGGRYFGRGDLRLVLLALIAEKPRHGYELIRSIAESSGGVYRPSPGVIYPTLTLLEDLGQVRTMVDAGQRRLHTITAEGRAYLDAHRVLLEQMKSRIPGRRTPEVAAQVGELRTAMELLKQALRATLAGGPIDARRMARIVAAIGRAAREVAGSEAA
jgi:DNA-binding PadR family transcriptional regulator